MRKNLIKKEEEKKLGPSAKSKVPNIIFAIKLTFLLYKNF
jgi:hypothetical protein